MSLKNKMSLLVKWVWRNADNCGFGPNDHHTLYHATARQFDLYDAKGHAPIWLSRVVAGVLQDRSEGSKTSVDV